MTIAFLFARQRSGTGALGSVLDQHPEIHYVGEVFHPGDVETNEYSYFRFLRALVETTPARSLPSAADVNLGEYLHYVKTKSPKPNVVIDVKYNSMHHFNRAWHGLLQRPRLIELVGGQPVLHLARRNFVRTYVSGRLAELNQVWHTSDATGLKHRKVEVDTSALATDLGATSREVEAMMRWVGGRPNVVGLEYAELFDDHGDIGWGVGHEIASVLGVAPFATRTPHFQKQAGGHLRETIVNYGEVADALAWTPYHWMMFAD